MEASSLRSTMLGETIVRILRGKIREKTGRDLTVEAVDHAGDLIDRMDPAGGILGMLDRAMGRTDDPAVGELLRLLELEDPAGRPWGGFGGRATADHLTQAAGIVSRLEHARYGIDETVNREALRLRMIEDPRQARETLMTAMDVVAMLTGLQDRADSRRGAREA